MTQSDLSGSPANGDSLPSRRELRAQREQQVPVTRPDAPVVTAAAASPEPQAAASAVGGSRVKRKNRLSVAVTLVAIPGLFLTTALPAYAFAPTGPGGSVTSAARSLTTSEAQGVTVAADSATITVARDGFTATTKEELAERERQAQRLAAAALAAERRSAAVAPSEGAFAVRGVRAEGDDYPWPYEATYDTGGGLSPLGYYYRECVDFVAWRLNRDAGSTGSPWRWTWSSLTPGGGSASSWAGAWSRKGWATSNTPVVGAVAWFNYNHVAYVQSVGDDGSVVLEEYNWMGSHAYHQRTVSASQVPLFLYPPA